MERGLHLLNSAGKSGELIRLYRISIRGAKKVDSRGKKRDLN